MAHTDAALLDHEPSIEALEDLCAKAPAKPQPLLDLTRALLRAGRAAEAVMPAEQAVALASGPAAKTALELRAAVMAAITAGDPSLVKLELAAALDPTNARAQLTLGETYVALDRVQDAERHYKRALRLGLTLEAHADLGRLYLTVGMTEAAWHHAQLALKHTSGTANAAPIVMAYQTLAAVCEARGDAQAAADHLDQAYNLQSLFRQPAPNCPFTTLILVTRRTGNIPYKSLLPPLRFDCAVWYMEHAQREQIAALPPYAVVLNAVGDPDIEVASRDIIDTFVSTCPRPVLNQPSRVRATFRHLIRETLSDLDGVFVPITTRLPGHVVAGQGLCAAVRATGLAFPLLVRPVGSHGGEGLYRVDSEADLESLDLPGGSDVYVSAFHEYRGDDGYYRKYRAIFVDRKPFPYHLAISRHWMVHHRSADMAGDPVRIEEEMRFLRDPEAELGQEVMAALGAIGQRLDLDYAGIDFTVTPDHQVFVFEANATMLTQLEPADGPFRAKNPYIQPIIDAFQTHLITHAGTSASVTNL